MAKPNILDTTISTLKKRNEPVPTVKQPDPILKTGHVVDLVWNKIVDFFTEVTSLILKNNYNVTVKNFPKTQQVQIVNTQDLLPPEKDTQSRIVTSLEALQQTIIDKPVTNIPETQKVIVENQITPEKIIFPTVQKVEVTNLEKPEKINFPAQMNVNVDNTKDITKSIDMMSAQMSQMMKQLSTDKNDVTPEQMNQMFQNMIDSLTLAIEQNKVTSVDVNNTGSFPVVFPIPTFKDIEGQNTQARVDDEGNQISKIKEVSPTDSSKFNCSIDISNDDMDVSSTKILTKTLGSLNYHRILSFNSSGDLISISSWS